MHLILFTIFFWERFWVSYKLMHLLKKIVKHDMKKGRMIQRMWIRYKNYEYHIKKMWGWCKEYKKSVKKVRKSTKNVNTI